VFEGTRTKAEQYSAEIERLNYLLSYGAINQDTYNRAVEGAKDKLERTTDSMSEFAVQAARNIETNLGSSLYDALTGNFDNIGEGFGKLMAKMVSDAAAAQMAIGLFGKDYGREGKLGGLVGMGISAIGSMFGGGVSTGAVFNASGYGPQRAAGGPVFAGTSYMIGERGPEMFVPNHSGRIISNSEMASSSNNQSSKPPPSSSTTAPQRRSPRPPRALTSGEMS
jgi:hypothetical protein